MLTKDIQLVVIEGFLICSLIGCTVTKNNNEDGNSMPESWFPVIANALDECVPVDGVYQTFGIGKYEEGEELVQARLDVALGHAYPSDRIPRRVSISLRRKTDMINIQFGQPINRSFLMPMSCSNGWFKIEQKQTNQYVGDGTTLDYLNRDIELGKTVDGDLIVHLTLEGQFSSFMALKSRDLRESWSKYEEIKSEN